MLPVGCEPGSRYRSGRGCTLHCAPADPVDPYLRFGAGTPATARGSRCLERANRGCLACRPPWERTGLRQHRLLSGMGVWALPDWGLRAAAFSEADRLCGSGLPRPRSGADVFCSFPIHERGELASRSNQADWFVRRGSYQDRCVEARRAEPTNKRLGIAGSSVEFEDDPPSTA
jgi:hypothetical protein